MLWRTNAVWVKQLRVFCFKYTFYILARLVVLTIWKRMLISRLKRRNAYLPIWKGDCYHFLWVFIEKLSPYAVLIVCFLICFTMLGLYSEINKWKKNQSIPGVFVKIFVHTYEKKLIIFINSLYLTFSGS